MNVKKMFVALADDDEDEHIFFKRTIDNVKITTELSLFIDGQELMDYLNAPINPLPDIVFLDLNMPVKNGMDCLREIRANNRFNGISVAVYSTSSSEADIEKTFVLGANVYINKPNNLGVLKTIIEKVLQTNWQYQTSRLNKENFLLRI